jgi:hypothetical protein
VAAELAVANRGDNKGTPLLLEELPGEVHDVLGDTQYNDPGLRRQCHRHGCKLVEARAGPYPHRGGVEVGKVCHKRRSQALGPFNGLFKNVFEGRVME